MMALQAAFLFLADGADPKTDRQIVKTPTVELTVVAVSTYAQAVTVAKALAEAGIGAIELCGGFGVEGTALVKHAVPQTVTVGVVRFDAHPGLHFQSGDALFGKQSAKTSAK